MRPSSFHFFLWLLSTTAHAGHPSITIEEARAEIEGTISPVRLVYFSAGPGPYQIVDAENLVAEMRANARPVYILDEERDLGILFEAQRLANLPSPLKIYLVLPQNENDHRLKLPPGVQLVTFHGAPRRHPDPYGGTRNTQRADDEGRDLLADGLLRSARSGHIDNLELVDYGGGYGFPVVALTLLARLRNERWLPDTPPITLRIHHTLNRRYGIGASTETLGFMANWPRLREMLTATPEGRRAIEHLKLDFRAYSAQRTDGRTDPSLWSNPPYRLDLEYSYPGVDGGKDFIDGILKDNVGWWGFNIVRHLDQRSLTSGETEALGTQGQSKLAFAAALSWRYWLNDPLNFAEAVELVHLENLLFTPESGLLAGARRGEKIPTAPELSQADEKFATRVAAVGWPIAENELAIFNRLNAQFIALAGARDPGPKTFYDAYDHLHALRMRFGGGGLGDLGGRFQESFANCAHLLSNKKFATEKKD